jgi:hypothetical protein
MKGKPYSLEISEEAENDFDNSYKYYFDDSPNVADILPTHKYQFGNHTKIISVISGDS